VFKALPCICSGAVGGCQYVARWLLQDGKVMLVVAKVLICGC